ncbi:MAG: marine proteobacterial sortase target protein [Alphaproteobacteria bacterium]
MPNLRAGASRSATLAIHHIQLMAALILAAILMAFAAGSPHAETVRVKDVESGSLLLRKAGSEPGEYLTAPAVETHVQMTVSGLIARVTVSQLFQNPSDDWIEGVYVFPLPENAAVDQLRLQVGDRFLEGKIKERAEARAIYEEAKASGKKAALLDEERPNIFTNAVANIGPHEQVAVQIEYQQSLRFDRNGVSLRFPMVVGPRYMPGPGPIASAGERPSIASPVPDAARITPPVLHPADGAVNPVTLDIALDAGMPVAWVKSPTHKLAVTEQTAGRYAIGLAGDAVFAEKDFVLEWLPDALKGPATALFTETLGDATYLLVTLLPPRERQTERPKLPREVIYIIDTSGSMEGPSIRQAKAALRLALDRLGPEDRFNVIRFSDTAGALFADARPATADSLGRARHFVEALKADGGTEMMAALRLALDGRTDPRRLRQIIFLTDGAVGNEDQLLHFIKEKLGDSRLFTIGIGSAPNAFLMTKAAEYGRGTYTFIDRVEDVGERMTALFEKIDEPVATDLSLRIAGDDGAEIWPKRPNDLYRGEPVVAAARIGRSAKAVEVSGMLEGRPWSARIPLAEAHPAKGVSQIWARRKIDALMDSRHDGIDEESVKMDVVTLALAHHLVSKYTSLVAIDVTPARTAGASITSRMVPTNLPEGWNFEKVFGPDYRMRAPASPRPPSSIDERDAALRPDAELVLNTVGQGATPATLHLLAGTAMIAVAVFVLLGRRRRT